MSDPVAALVIGLKTNPPYPPKPSPRKTHSLRFARELLDGAKRAQPQHPEGEFE